MAWYKEHMTTKTIRYRGVALQEESLTFVSRAGVSLAAKLEYPSEDFLHAHPELGGKPWAVVVYAPCFTCGKDIAAARNITRGLAQRGMLALRLDFTGLGESEGEFAESGFSSNREDLLSAVRELAKRGHETTLLVGHSLGGTAALASVGAAMEFAPIKGAVTIASPADPAHAKHLFGAALEAITTTGKGEIEVGGRKFSVSREFLQDLESQCPDSIVPNLHCPVLVMHAPGDNTVGVDNAAKIFSWAKHPKSFVSLDRADHVISNADDADYVAEMIAAWASRFHKPHPVMSGSAKPAASAGQSKEEQGEEGEEGQVIVSERLPFGALTQEVSVRNHKLLAGEPVPIGDDAGPTPYDYLLAGLGACTSMTVRLYAKRKGWDLQQVSVRLSHARRHATDCEVAEGASAQLEEIVRVVNLVGNLDDTQRARLLEIADKCPVHRTLTGKVIVKTELG